MEINNLLEGSASEFKVLQEDAARLADKWSQSGLLEGLEGNDSSIMARILENQAKQLVSEVSTTGTTGTFTAGAGEQWAGVALPLVRKVFAQIAAKDFVSVQPMNLPSGLVFYLDFKYGSSTAGFTSGDNMYGNVSTANDKMSVDEEVSGGLYGAGQFGYSINSASTAVSLITFAAANSASIGYDDAVPPSHFKTATVSLSGTGFDSKGVRAFRILSGSTDVTSHPEFTTVSGNNVTFVISGSVLAQTTNMSGSVVYHKQPGDNSRGDFEDTTGTLKIPEVNVTLASEAIVAKTRKLKAQWTPEFAQDLNAYHSVDAEAELTNIMSEYISMEIDLEILDMLIEDAAAATEYWSAANNNVYNASTQLFSTGGSAFYNTQGQWFQTLGTKIQKVSNKIHQLTLRGGANFLVTSPTVATILESIPGFASTSNGDTAVGEYAFGVQKIGTINNRYKVYKNPYFTDNLILMGYRGSQFLETGAVFAPYIPLIMTPLIYDPETFTPRKGLMTRYAKKMLRPEYYGKIYVDGLNTI